ncbi:MAG: hypothetical protein EBY13_05130, partial [Actinobacteria bacterium]|nr:hypothetical protein [Actinomycetota bacterium]
LANTSQVYFGGTAATITSSSNDSITVSVSTPAGGVGAVDVYVVTPGGTSNTLINAFTYIALPTVQTDSATAVAANSAQLNGLVKAGADTSTVSFFWGTSNTLSSGETVTASQSPVIGNVNTQVSYNLSGLTTNTTYYFRVSATNSLGTSYGTIKSFVPVTTALSIATSSIDSGTVGTSYSFGLTATGGTGTYSSWAHTSGTLPTGLTFNTTTGVISGTPSETATARSLTFSVTDSLSQSATKTLTLTVNPGVPTATTNAATSVAATSATLNGSITANGASTTITFCVSTSGTTTAGALTCASSPVAIGATSPSTTSTTSSASASVTGLTSGTQYYYQIKGVNSAGTSYGSVLSFVPSSAPTVTTNNADTITATSAALSGSVTANGSSTTITFCVSTSNAVDGNGALTSCSLSPTSSPLGTLSSTSASASSGTLSAGTTYSYQLIGTNSSGTTYGTYKSFTTLVAAPAFTLSSSSETRTVNTAITGYTISSTGGAIASYSISSTPAGLTFSTSTGLLSGSPSTVAAATSYTITATNANTTATRTFTLTVLVAAPAFTISPIAETVTVNTAITGYTISSTGGAVASYSISSTPAGLTFSTSTGLLSGSPTTVAAATSYTITATNANTTATRTFTLTVVKASRTLTIDSGSYTSTYSRFATLPTLTSTASAGTGTKNYTSSTTGVCTVNLTSGLVSFVSVGTCRITASIATDATYLAATSAEINFAIALASRTLSIDASSYTSTYTMIATPPTLTSTPSAGTSTGKSYSSSTSGVCTVNSSTGLVAFVSIGTCTLSAAITADSNYSSADSTSISFAVTKASQSITFPSMGSMVVGETISVTVSATSGLTITLTPTDLTKCTISGLVVTAVAAGDCTLTATQTGDGSYNAASSVPQTFAISSSLAAPIISISPTAETVTVNTAITGYVVSQSGGAPASYGISSTPAGLSFGTSNGLLSGSPTSVAGATSYVITATNGAGNSTSNYTLTVLAAPTISGLSPIVGTTAGGTTVTITGTNLTGTNSVTFGGTTATIVSTSGTSVVVTTPAHALGLVNVALTVSFGGSVTSTGAFTYVQPPAF